MSSSLFQGVGEDIRLIGEYEEAESEVNSNVSESEEESLEESNSEESDKHKEDNNLEDGEDSDLEDGEDSDLEDGEDSDLEDGEDSDLEDGEDSDLEDGEDSDEDGEDSDEDGEDRSDVDDTIPDEARVIKGVWQEAEAADTSDEEEVRNTLGNIPLEWYEDYNHLGYDLEGVKIPKPPSDRKDQLEEFLSKIENADYWRTITDRSSGKGVVLTDNQIDIIQKLQHSNFPEEGAEPYAPYVEHFSGVKAELPLSVMPKPKSSFIPSRWEHRKIVKLAHAMKIGRIKVETEVPSKPIFFQLWGEDGDTEGAKKRRHQVHIPAPRLQLPGHAESYNPPPEYLPSQQEVEKWKSEREEDRETDFLPHKYGSLREVPGYSFIRDRFERCLDLYLCPRQQKMRVQVEPEDLIPKLPPLRDLQPFPTQEALRYEGHEGKVLCVAVHTEGQWLASCSSDKSVKLWELTTARCLRTRIFDDTPRQVAFSPNPDQSLLLVALEKMVVLMNSEMGDGVIVKKTSNMLLSLPIQPQTSGVGVVWERLGEEVCLIHEDPVQQICWHEKGDYFAVVTTGQASVHVHQSSKGRSQRPFKKIKGQVQKVLFHPHKPFFFLATQSSVRVYDLVRQELVKRLLTGMKWISFMAVHPTGDHLLVSSHDKKLCWIDVELSSKPYKTMKHHNQAVRCVCIHQSLPLFASGGDDGRLVVCHGKVFNDLLQNPLLVPVKQLRGSARVDGLGVTWCDFHPRQPWLLCAGVDSIIRLFA